jgi:hypothetical protein
MHVYPCACRDYTGYFEHDVRGRTQYPPDIDTISTGSGHVNADRSRNMSRDDFWYREGERERGREREKEKRERREREERERERERERKRERRRRSQF